MQLPVCRSNAGNRLCSSAEAIGLRYNAANRIDGYNISQGESNSIAIYRSEGYKNAASAAHRKSRIHVFRFFALSVCVSS